MTLLRAATPADLAPILALQAQFYAEDGYAFDEAQARAALARLLGDPGLGLVWVATDGEQVVGYAALTFGYSLEYRGRDAFVDELYLVPSHRGQGTGARALELMEASCAAHAVRALHLEVERDKLAAQSLYRRQGFVDRGRHLMTRRLG